MKVYRLRNLPHGADRQQAAELLAACAAGVAQHTIRVFSIAHVIDPWTRPPTKTATLTIANFDVEAHAQWSSGPGEWTLHTPGLPEPLVLDGHFHGFTPLNEVDPEAHRFDCIAVSGLASHPFGSWQPHGGDKSYMWIRDKLTAYHPAIRFSTYGYDTKLYPSASFQSVPDLSNSLISALKGCGWSSPNAKPLIFLAHSLGGVVLKQAMVMLAGSGQTEAFILSLVRGAIFFGVPSRGMPMDDLKVMLGTQPNAETLVKEISDTSNYLESLERQFTGISLLSKVTLFWAYETKITPTIIEESKGKFKRSGAGAILVTKASATAGRSKDVPLSTIQIDENHSDMVKFSLGDQRVHIFASKINEICGTPPLSVPAAVARSHDRAATGEPGIMIADQQLAALEVPQWADNRILESLGDPELNSRVQQIDSRSSHTFDWTFDDPSAGLSQWLRRGRGIFWIRGKPGSGKSTLMKFIHYDPRTMELTRRWKSTARQVRASFFFHYRGTVLQKSFDGLLRGIISQLLAAEPKLLAIVRSSLSKLYTQQAQQRRLGSLRADILYLMGTAGLHRGTNLDSIVDDIVQNQDATSALQTALTSCRNQYRSSDYVDLEEFDELEVQLLRRRDEVLRQGRAPRIEDFLDCGHRSYTELQVNVRRTLVSNWLKELDLGAKLREVVKDHAAQRMSPEPAAQLSESIQAALTMVIDNQLRRDRLRLDIQYRWSRERLEDLLRQICEQDIFDLDLFLFLDALDEYDGRPEFISQFLQDLSEENAFPRTRIRVLFSSRPWPIFQEEFASCPGFPIHDFTQDDIRSYCITNIPNNLKAACDVRQLVEDIVSRSRGVFLWVKLVVSDLQRAIADGNSMSTTSDVNGWLRQTLDSMPDQLDDYYETIIQRISPGLRWRAYVVLETLARSNFVLSPHRLVQIVRASEKATTTQYAPISRDNETSAEEMVRNVSGGLVEIFDNSQYENSQLVQLMHQTVKDFVLAPRFRYIVLGKTRAELTEENGHSFIIKALVQSAAIEGDTWLREEKGRLLNHLRQAEKTTGVSQHDLLYSADPRFLDEINVVSALTLAVKSGLQLFIEDAVRRDPQVIMKCPWSLLNHLLSGIHSGLPLEDATGTLQSLLARGLVLNNNMGSLISLLEKTGPCDGDTCATLACVVADHIKDVNVPIRWELRLREGQVVEFAGEMIHISPPPVAARLLGRGANPNALARHAETQWSPLDHMIQYPTLHPSSPSYLYELAELFLRYGGKLYSTTVVEWDLFLQHISVEGFDISIDAGDQFWRPLTALESHETDGLRNTVGIVSGTDGDHQGRGHIHRIRTRWIRRGGRR